MDTGSALKFLATVWSVQPDDGFKAIAVHRKERAKHKRRL
jgi:hypothetical protein